MECKFCGLHHELCINHFAAKCLQQRQRVNLVVQEESLDSELEMMHVVHGLPSKGQIYAEPFVHDKPVKLPGDVELWPTTTVLHI